MLGIVFGFVLGLLGYLIGYRRASSSTITSWAGLAKRGSGYVRCQTLGVYIVTEEFFNKIRKGGG